MVTRRHTDAVCNPVGVTDCTECGFVYEDLAVENLTDTLRSFGDRYRAELLGDTADETVLRRRPAPGVWSALEYACHVRDVLLIQRDRTLLALVEDRPSFRPMYREERVALAHYAAEPPAEVGRQLAMAADLAATVFGGLTADQVRRPCVYNYPAPANRDVAWLGRHTVHEGEHHLMDIRSVLARAKRPS